MKRIQTNQKGKKGIAVVKVGGSKVQIKFKDEDEPRTFPKSEVPDTIKNGTWYLNLTGDEDGILGVRPVMGVFKAKFKEFTSKEDEPPAPMEMPGGVGHTKAGKSFSYDPYLAFIALVEIISPDAKGMVVPVFLRYLFTDDGDGGVAVKGSGKNADLLEAFLEAVGVYDDVIKFSDNILPLLQKKILKKNAVFQIMLKDGNLEAFMENLDEETLDDDGLLDDDDEFGDDDDTLTEEKLPDDDDGDISDL